MKRNQGTLLVAKETTIRVANTKEISKVRQECRAQVAVEDLTVIIEPMIHGTSATTESMTMVAMGDGEESRFPNSKSQNVEHGRDFARQEGVSLGKELFEMEEEKVTITLKEAEADRDVDRHLLGPRGGIDEREEANGGRRSEAQD